MGFRKWIHEKTAGPYSGAGGSYFAPFTDLFRKNRSPSPLELIQENLGTASTCVRLNSDLVASTTFRLFVTEKKGQGKSRMSARGETRPVSNKTFEHLSKSPFAAGLVRQADNVEEVVTHPLLDLLDNPNDPSLDGVGLSRFSLLELTSAYMDVVGKAFWYIERNGIGGTPSGIWILASHMVQTIPMPTRRRSSTIISSPMGRGKCGMKRMKLSRFGCRICSTRTSAACRRCGWCSSKRK